MNWAATNADTDTKKGEGKTGLKDFFRSKKKTIYSSPEEEKVYREAKAKGRAKALKQRGYREGREEIIKKQKKGGTLKFLSEVGALADKSFQRMNQMPEEYVMGPDMNKAFFGYSDKPKTTRKKKVRYIIKGGKAYPVA